MALSVDFIYYREKNVATICQYLVMIIYASYSSFFLSIVQVLSKFPVIQHFVFGTLLSIQETEVFKKPL